MRRTYLLDALVLCADSSVQSIALLALEQIGERESDDEGVDKEEQHVANVLFTNAEPLPFRHGDAIRWQGEGATFSYCTFQII